MSLGAVLALTLLAAIGGLDPRLLGDIGIERPVFMGPLVGLILGHPLEGLAVGAGLELVWLGVQRIGGAAPPNIVVGGILGTAFAIATQSNLATALLVAVPAALIGQLLEDVIKTANTFLAHRVDACAERGDTRGIAVLAWASTLTFGIADAVPVFLALEAGIGPVKHLVAVLPANLDAALAVTGGVLPVIGFAMLLMLLVAGGSLWYFVIGFVLAAYTHINVVGLALLAVAAAALQLRPRLRGRRGAGTAPGGVKDLAPRAAAAATAAGRVGPRDLRTIFWRSMMLNGPYNLERLQNVGFCWQMLPLLRKLYPERERLREALRRHLQLFDCYLWMAPAVAGVVASMEDRRAAGDDLGDEAITAAKVGLMGPITGIGQSLVKGALRIVMAGVAIALAQQGNMLAPAVYLAGNVVIAFPLRWYTLLEGYIGGTRLLTQIPARTLKAVTDAAHMVGLVVIGGLAATLIKLNTPVALGPHASVKLQALFNSVLPGLIPLLLIFGTLWLLRRRLNPGAVLGALFICGMAGGLLHWLV